MHTSHWIIAAGLLRLLPSCTASPIAAVASPVSATTKQSAASLGFCGKPEVSGTSAECWTTLGIDNFLANWTQKTVMAGAPMIGTIVCRPTEDWAQCFIRFAYGHQKLTAAPMDCVTLSSTSCTSPSRMMIKPTSPQYFYGLHVIHSIFNYIKTLSIALLSTTGTPNTLQKFYTSALFGNDPADSPNPVDAVLATLLQLNTTNTQDTQFRSYVLSSPYPANFSTNSTSTTTSARSPTDEILYKGVVASLEARLKGIMSNWTEFETVLGTEGAWMGKQVAAGEYVKAWTDISPVTAGLLDALGSGSDAAAGAAASLLGTE